MGIEKQNPSSHLFNFVFFLFNMIGFNVVDNIVLLDNEPIDWTCCNGRSGGDGNGVSDSCYDFCILSVFVPSERLPSVSLSYIPG